MKTFTNFFKIQTILLVMIFALTSMTASASHFRYGTMSWEIISTGPGGTVVEFNITQSWRNWGNFVVGDVTTNGTGYLKFGDGSQVYVQLNVTNVNVPGDFFVGSATYTHTYTGTTDVLAYFNGCCRISSLEEGNADAAFRNETNVTLSNPSNNSPVANTTPIFYVGVNQTTDIQLAAFDPDGDAISFAYSTIAKSGLATVVPSISTGLSSYGLLGINTNSVIVGDQFATQVIVTDANGASIPLDFILEIVAFSNPPVFIAPTPANATVINVGQGDLATFDAVASDTDPGSIVSIFGSGLPVGSSFTGTPGNPASYTFSWTPAASDLGAYVIALTAQDELYAQANTSVTIFVKECSIGATAVITDVSCSGSSDGEIDLSLSGDYGSPIFSWAGPNGFSASTEDISGVEAGSYTVTATGDFGLGCSVTETFEVETAPDIIPPIALCQNITVDLDASGNATITPQDVDGGSTDNCGIASMSLSNTTFSCADVDNVNFHSADFEGTNYISISDAPDLRITGDITLEGWFKMDAHGNDWVRIAGKGNATYRNYGIWYHPSGVFLFQQYGGGANVYWYSAIQPGQWYHVAGVKQGNVGSLYVDGNLVSTNASAGGTPYTSAHPFVIGYGFIHQIQRGQIDEVRLWNLARSASEIQNNYASSLSGNEPGLVAYYNMEAGTGSTLTDNSGNNHTGNMNNVSWSVLTPYGTKVDLMVVDFNGNMSSCIANVAVQDNMSPTISCPTPDASYSADFGLCSASLTFDATTSDNCEVASTEYSVDGTAISFPYSFPLGTTTVDVMVKDIHDNTNTCSFDVVVTDNEAPVLTAISTPITLWPPNHKYETIDMSQLFVSVDDNCGVLTIDDVYITSVSSDEVENGSGDGNTVDDIVIDSDCSSVDLRKERSGNENGRVYTIYMAVDDGNGNTGTSSCQVHVPHDKNGTAIDDGMAYEVECFKSAFASFTGDDIQLMNYPNPFNGSTTVSFTLTETENTTLKVYDTFGKEVATLFDGMAESGQEYKFEFSSGNLAKGIYVYRLQSGTDVSVVKKMILMK